MFFQELSEESCFAFEEEAKAALSSRVEGVRAYKMFSVVRGYSDRKVFRGGVNPVALSITGGDVLTAGEVKDRAVVRIEVLLREDERPYFRFRGKEIEII